MKHRPPPDEPGRAGGDVSVVRMPDRLDSHALKRFLAVAEAASFRQAAEKLHLSQPPLSRAIAKLEDVLGVRLFDRHARGVTMTDAGRVLEPHAHRVIDLLRRAESDLMTMQKRTKLRLGVTSAVQTEWFAGLLDRVLLAAPGLSVTTHSDTSPRLIRLLRAGRLDAAFIALPTESSGIIVEQIEVQPMVVALSSSHRLARRRRLSLTDLKAESLLWFERARQPAFFDHCRAVFEAHGFEPTTLREPVDHHVLLAEVAAGRGVSLLPKSFTSLKRPGVAYRALVEGSELYVGVGLALQPEQRHLRDLLLASL